MLRLSRTSLVVLCCYFHTSNMSLWGAFNYLFWTLVNPCRMDEIVRCPVDRQIRVEIIQSGRLSGSADPQVYRHGFYRAKTR